MWMSMSIPGVGAKHLARIDAALRGGHIHPMHD